MKKISLILLVIVISSTSYINAQENDWHETSLFPADGGQDRQEFGHDLYADSNLIVVTALNDFSGGAAYVYEKVGSDWAQQAKLTVSNAEAVNFHAQTVAYNNDCIVVGSSDDSTAGYYAGAAYVYEKPINGWTDMTETAQLTASDPDRHDEFGSTVAINGDQIIVGAWYKAEDGHDASGAAYFYQKPDNGWADMTETYKILPDTSMFWQMFGWSIELQGDYAFIGTPTYADTGYYGGAVYIFEITTDSSIQHAKLTNSDIQESSTFGHDLAIEGDILLIGATSGYDNDGIRAGTAYVYQLIGDDWTPQAKLVASDGADWDRFAWSIDLANDQIIIGAKGHSPDPNHDDVGAAYLFVKPANGWTDTTETHKFMASNSQEDSYFGFAVSLSGADPVISAPQRDTNEGYDAGAVYIYHYGTVATDDQPWGLPDSYALHQNYPNPFNPITTISYRLPQNSHVILTVYDILGNQVTELVSGQQSAGPHQIVWNGYNYLNQTVGSGVYLYQIKADNFSQTKKMMFVK